MNCPPVLFLIFNRPDLVAESFAPIRAAQPEKLFIAADGPRHHKDGEEQQCHLSRRIVDAVDWQCEVHTLFRERNLGCELAVSSAINWFFEHVEEGIIIEDDVVATPKFFHFCSQALEKYREAETIMHIGGASFLPAAVDMEPPVYCSKLMHCWGWATWRRAWREFRFNIDDSSFLVEKHLKAEYGATDLELNFWKATFCKIRSGRLNTWAWRWQYAIWRNKALCIVPRDNLVSNLGFDDRATHTINGSHESASPANKLIYSPDAFPLPLQDKATDNLVSSHLRLLRAPTPHKKMGLLQRAKRFVLKLQRDN